MNSYEEFFPEKISYCTYERDIAEKDNEIEKLQDEIHTLTSQTEYLEGTLKEFIKYIKSDVNDQMKVSALKTLTKNVEI